MNKKAKEMKISDARRQESLEGKLITKCCELIDSSIRMASHILEMGKLEFEALITVMILVNANFLSAAVRMYKGPNDKIIDMFLDEVREKAKEFIKEDQKEEQKDINAN